MSETPSELEVITKISAVFDDSKMGGGEGVQKSLVKEWMSSESISIRGAIYDYVSDASYSKIIDPHMTLDDYFDFIVPYLLDCIKSNPDSEWAHGRYIAGHELVGWIKDFWKKGAPEKKLNALKNSLAAGIKVGGEGIKDAIVNAVLEHLFEDSGIRKFFSDWREDPELKRAYEDAMLWSTKSGTKPI
jgi:hypothetical protein